MLHYAFFVALSVAVSLLSWGCSEPGTGGDGDSDADAGGDAGSDAGCHDDDERPCGTGLGICADAVESCVDGEWGACSIAPEEEACNDLDDDCDGETDEDLSQLYYQDSDADGYGNPEVSVEACSPPEGYVDDDSDCDDDCFECNLGATEVCDGAVDENCDSAVDEGCDCLAEEERSCGNGIGLCDGAIQTCEDGAWSTCSVVPDEESCNALDDDCDGEVDEDVMTAYYVDADGDGFGSPHDPVEACSPPDGHVADGSDCDDACAECNPEVSETCDDAIDNDCNGSVDEGCTCTAGTERPCGSGLGACTGAVQTCDGDGAWGDCSIVPGDETCNTVDDDCDGETDEGLTTTYFEDFDGDGYGNPDVSADSCDPLEGYVEDDSDCNDTCIVCYPGATEVCEGSVDESCDGTVDESCACTDGEDRPCGNGLGECDGATQTCEGGEWAACSVIPNEEVCNERDDDCDGDVDDGVLNQYYLDFDGDLFGNPDDFVNACSPPEGYVLDAGDCNDDCATCNPRAPEICDGLDNDCDGAVDDGLMVTYYADTDGDNYGNPALSVESCSGPPEGYVLRNTDCNDSCTACHPGGTEVCEGTLDENCDGTVDDGCACTDGADRPCGTGLGECAGATQLCADGAWGACSLVPGDETCNGLDDDCDGTVDNGPLLAFYPDTDGDSYGAEGSSPTMLSCPEAGMSLNDLDCDDGNFAIKPSAREICDLVDNDCDGSIDEGIRRLPYYHDGDGDGYGDPLDETSACMAPPDHVSNDDDCDDGDDEINPDALEVCDAVDHDCDGNNANEPEATASCPAVPFTDTIGCVVGRNPSCRILRCDRGHADCDGIYSTGCEANLAAEPNCGGCGIECDDDEICAGTCVPLPTHDWSTHYGGTENEKVSNAAFDFVRERIFVAGTYADDTDFGDGAVPELDSGPTLTDGFLAAYDFDGNYLWAMPFGDSSDDEAMDVAVDGNGNVYIVGRFGGTINLGGSDLSAESPRDVVVASFNGLGGHRWSRAIGSDSTNGVTDTGNEFGLVLAVPNNALVTIAGAYNGTSVFDGVSATSNGTDLFLMTFAASNGATLVPVSTYGGSGNEFPEAATGDQYGNIFVTGDFTGQGSFGGSTFTAQANDIFVVRYDALLDHEWSRPFGGSGADSGVDIVHGVGTNLVVVGTYNGTVNFGLGNLATYPSTNSFVMLQNDATGDPVWANGYGGPEFDGATAVAVDSSTNVYVTGMFEGSIELGGGTLTEIASYSDIFVASYDSAGAYRWANNFDGGATNLPRSIGLDTSGGVYVVGSYNSTADFGGGDIPTNGNYDIFLTRYLQR